MRVLIIEDDAKVGTALKAGLEPRGVQRVVVPHGRGRLLQGHDRVVRLVVLDPGLPGRSGLEVLSGLRGQGIAIPVLILTARDTVEDRVQGLDAGADDFLTKPFAFAELLARLRALLRRGRSDDVHRLRLADLELDSLSRIVTRGGVAVGLTVREFDLLAYLLRHQGQVVSREMLAREVWQEPSRGTPLDNVIDVHMAHLRKKVDRDLAHRLIHTVRGVGFLVKNGA